MFLCACAVIAGCGVLDFTFRLSDPDITRIRAGNRIAARKAREDRNASRVSDDWMFEPARVLASVMAVVALLLGFYVLNWHGFFFRFLSDLSEGGERTLDKPVIYLYPESDMEVHVGLDPAVSLMSTYPTYPEGGWDVVAHPDGTLDHGGKRYRYLFWEGVDDRVVADFSEGWCVESDGALAFLEEKLTEIGLSEYEKQEMIVYWLPILERNRYSLVQFLGEEYADVVGLDIYPEPDSLLRVFMAVKAVDGFVEIEPQELGPFVRDGFVAIEWGGMAVG